MAELGTIIAVIQIADRIICLCKYWIETVQDAPADLRFILIESFQLKSIFKGINFLVSHDASASPILSGLLEPVGPITQCRQILDSLEGLLPPMQERVIGKRTKKQKLTAALEKLAWPLKETKARKLLEELSHYKSTINLALTTDYGKDIKEVKLKTREIYDVLTDTQRDEVYKWLQQTNPSSLYNKNRENIENTCNWILRTPEWMNWLSTKNKCLWIHGIPGAGKSVLASYIIGQLEKICSENGSSNCITIYYYCYHGHNQDEAAPFLRWLLSQICLKTNRVPDKIYDHYKKRYEPIRSDLLDAIAACISNFQAVYVILDAVDESKPRTNLLKACTELVQDSRFNAIKLLATSRDYREIKTVFDDISIPLSMSNAYVEEDIRVYVHHSLKTNEKFENWSKELLLEVEDTLSKKAKGMFRWAVCQIFRLQKVKSEPDIVRDELARLPKTLDETYERIFLEIPKDVWPILKEAFLWIKFHFDLLSRTDGFPLEVLLKAIDRGNNSATSEHSNLVIDQESLQDICGCLINISKGTGIPINNYDSGELLTTNVVSFAHYTVREFLDSQRISNMAQLSYFSLQEKQGRTQMIKNTFDGVSDFDDEDSRSYGEIIDKMFDAPNVEQAFNLLATNFRSYCIIMATLIVYQWADDIVVSEYLMSRVYNYFHPSSSNNELKLIIDTVSFLELDCSEDLYALVDRFGQLSFQHITWGTAENDPARNAMMLLQLLLMDSAPKLVLTQRYLSDIEHSEAQRLAKSVINFSAYLCFLYYDINDHYEFYTTVIEFIAQLSEINDWSFHLRFLLDNLIDLHDPTLILLSYIGQHHHQKQCENKGGCILQILLAKGAQHSGNASAITPLQIAVFRRDIEGVSAMITAGADPNGRGDPNGDIWDTKDFRGRFNVLKGLKPLEICRQEYAYFDRNCGYYKQMKDQFASEGKKIEEYLIEKGATC